MLTIKHDLRTDPMCADGATIRHIADCHLGSPNCDLDLVNSLVQENVANHWYTFLVGDLWDVGLKDSKTDVFTQTGTITYWLDEAVEIFKPLAENGLILGVVQGNHENRLVRAAGMDLTHELCERLGVGHLYNPHSVIALIQVGKQGSCTRTNGKHYNWACNYLFHVTHGHGGGRSAGGRSNALKRASEKIDSDVYLQGHTHHSDVLLGSTLRVNRQHMLVTQVDQVFVCCGSCLTYEDSYGEGMNLAPSDNRYPRVFLHADCNKVEATV